MDLDLRWSQSSISTQPIGLAVAGYGYWGPNLVRNFASTDGVRVIAVSDLKANRLASAMRSHPGIRVTVDFRELLKDSQIDAIAIATPVHTHYELALSALRAGKHVLVEKPLAQTSDQVKHLIDEADRRNLILMVDHTFLYTPAVQKVRQIIQEGDLGDIYYYNSTRASLGLFQPDVNVLWDLAVHDISVIDYILPEAPVAVSATGISHVLGTPESMAHIALFFESNCVGHISVNWLSPVKVRQTFIGGSRKMIIYDDVEPTEKVKIYDRGITVENSSETAQQLRIGYRAGDMCAPHLTSKEALKSEAEHFVACICSGTAPISSAVSGLRTIQILEAASQSLSAKGSPIAVEAMPSKGATLEALV